MNSGTNRDELPDISSIIEFSKRLREGVSQQEAERFIRREKSNQKRNASVIVGAQFDPKRVFLYSHPSQYGNVTGVEVEGFLKRKKHLGNQELEYFLAHQDSIPNSWERNTGAQCVFFWDAAYNNYGTKMVPFLFYSRGRWERSIRATDTLWFPSYYAAVYDPPF